MVVWTKSCVGIVLNAVVYSSYFGVFVYSELEYSVFLVLSKSVLGTGAVKSWCVAMARAVSALSV